MPSNKWNSRASSFKWNVTLENVWVDDYDCLPFFKSSIKTRATQEMNSKKSFQHNPWYWIDDHVRRIRRCVFRVILEFPFSGFQGSSRASVACLREFNILYIMYPHMTRVTRTLCVLHVFLYYHTARRLYLVPGHRNDDDVVVVIVCQETQTRHLFLFLLWVSGNCNDRISSSRNGKRDTQNKSKGLLNFEGD